MSDRITRDEVAQVARLARLRLSDDELNEFTEQLGAVLDHAADIEALDVHDLEPMAHPLPMVNVMRADEPRPGIDRDAVMAEAPAAESGRFRVPPVLGEEP